MASLKDQIFSQFVAGADDVFLKTTAIGTTVQPLLGYTPLSTAGGTLTGDLTINTTGALKLPVGTTVTRPASPVNGMLRYNSSDNKFEGYINGTWGSVGGVSGAFIENDYSITQNYTITSGKHALSVGPLDIAEGVVVNVPDGSRWVIL